MVSAERPGPHPEFECSDWVVERGVRFDPQLPAATRERILSVLTERPEKQDWGNFGSDTRTWFEHLGIGSTAVPTTDVLRPYALLSGAKTAEQVAAERTGVHRFLNPGLDPRWLAGATQHSEVWDVRLDFADAAAQRAFTEFTQQVPADVETQRIYVGLAPMPFDQATGKVRMPEVTSLGDAETPLPAALRGKVTLAAFRASNSWLVGAAPETRADEPLATWIDNNGLRIEHITR